MNTSSKPYRFTRDWFTQTAAHWGQLFRNLKWNFEQPRTLVEIGSYEGASAVWMLEQLAQHPDTRLYCLDTFEGSIEHDAAEKDRLRQRFDYNINTSGKAAQVEVLAGRSDDGLVQLLSRGIRADFVYVDGSHQAADVLADAILGWKLLKPGGLMIFDDYIWPVYQNQPLKNPKIAIDAFVNCHLDQLRFVVTPQRTQFGLLKVPPMEFTK